MSTHTQRMIRLRRAVRHMRPKHIVATRLTRRTVERFAEKFGLVYFGRVDQRDDEHRLIRGYTVSATHIDNHYCIGSVRGYDVMMVSRNDVTKRPGDKREYRHHWLICTVDLHTKTEVPRCYIGYRAHEAVFMSQHGQWSSLFLGGISVYPHQFISAYTTYGRATHVLDIQRTITPQIAMVMATHFAGASVEIDDNTVYLYLEDERPTSVTLEKMLSNALWLAEQIDGNSQSAVAQ